MKMTNSLVGRSIGGPQGAAWAASQIALPFVYLPLDVALAGAPATVTNHGNAGPATFTITDTGGTYDDTEGYLSGSTGLIVHPNSATYDAVGNSLYDMGDLFRNYVQASGTGGRILMAAFSFNFTAAASPGPIFGFGMNSANASSRGWFIGHSTGANTDLIMGAHYDNITPYINSLEVTTSGGGLAPADGTTRHFALLLNAAQKNLRLIKNNVEETLSVASILSAWKTAPNNNGITVGTRNTSAVAGSRGASAAILASTAHVRNLFLMDLTSLGSADAENEFPVIADALYKSPNYTLPRYLAKF